MISNSNSKKCLIIYQIKHLCLIYTCLPTTTKFVSSFHDWENKFFFAVLSRHQQLSHTHTQSPLFTKPWEDRRDLDSERKKRERERGGKVSLAEKSAKKEISKTICILTENGKRAGEKKKRRRKSYLKGPLMRPTHLEFKLGGGGG